MLQPGSVILAGALIIAGASASFAQNYEYSTSYQRNLTQVQVNKTLHINLKNYIAPYSAARSVGIAILDGRADANHVDLRGRIGVHLVYGGSYSRLDSHGTHVAGIAGGSQNGTGIVGVAPTARLFSIPVFSDSGWAANDLGWAALNKAASLGAKVVNMSYGPTSPGDVFLSGELDLFDNYLGSMVIARAAGNNGITALNEYYGGDASASLAHLLIVGSVNANNQISSFSTRPGEACIAASSTCNADDKMKNFFIVAPGERILSDLPGNRYGTMSGTSMATPHVAGAAALVFQDAYDGRTFLTPAQVAEILKVTATDLGDRGVDGVYGWGLLNVTKALGPVGPTKVATTGTVGTSNLTTSGSTLTRSSTLGRSSAFERILDGMLVFDSYGRGFVMSDVDIGGTGSSLADEVVSALGTSPLMQADVMDSESGRLSLLQVDDAASGFSGLSFETEGYAISTGVGNTAAYFTQTGTSVDDSQSRQLGTRFFTGAGDVGQSFTSGYFSGGDIALSPRLILSALFAHGSDEVLKGESSWMDSGANASSTSDFATVGATLGLGRSGTLGFSVGILREEDAMLGIESDGAFSLGETAYTQLIGLSYAHKLTHGLSVDAFAQLGLTGTTGDEESIFSSVSDVWSTKMGLSLTGSSLIQPRDTVQLALVSPWRIVEGDVEARVAVGREFDGTVIYEPRRMSLADGDVPLDLGMSYMMNAGSLSYGASIWLRDSDIATVSVDEAVAAAGFSMKF